MNYTKHLILTVLAMVLMANVWGMDIYFHYANGSWPTGIAASNFTDNGDLKVDCEPSDHISEVKTKIANLTGLLESGMQMSFGSQSNLQDNMTIADYNIQKESTITLTYVDPVPRRQADNSWHIQTMPRGNRVLRTTWKTDAALAWKIGNDPVPTQGVSGYLGFDDPAHVNFPTLDNPKHCTVHYGSSNVAVATIEANGAISFLSAGTTTIYAVHYTNEDENSYLYDSVYYTLTVKTPPTLTLATTGDGTVALSQVFTNEFTDWTAVDNSWHTGEMPQDFVPITAAEAMTWTEAPQGTTSYLIYGIEVEVFHCVKYAPSIFRLLTLAASIPLPSQAELLVPWPPNQAMYILSSPARR